MICKWCGGDVDPITTPCPKSIECPTCGAKPGSPCKRPSGHKAMNLHIGRVNVAEAMPPRPTDSIPEKGP